jgi:argininosuccinate lyase
LLGFESLHVNSVYAQMTRGKTEKWCATALAAIAATLSKLAMDICLYCGGNYGFICFPDELTTGSSIMPHKKNPDAWELIRAKCNRLQSVPNEFALLLANLPSGYHRDLQLTKEILFPAIETLEDCLEMSIFMLEKIIVVDPIPDQEKYEHLYTVDAVNALVQNGTPFREAYRQVGFAVENGVFEKPGQAQHTHTGSSGNLGNDLIKKSFEEKLEKIVVPKIYKVSDKD